MSQQRKKLNSATGRGNKLEEFRGAMPVNECAARVGCLYGLWYKWERGDSFPTLPYIPRIEDLMTSLVGRPVSYREIWPGVDPSLDGLES